MPNSQSERAARVAALVLAGGASERLGTPKQLVVHRGEPLVRRAAAAASQAGARPVIVVLGAEAARVAEALRDVPRVATVLNEHWRDGVSSSIVTGVREAIRLDGGCDGVVMVVTDQPFVDGAALRRLLDAFASGHRIVAAEYSETIGVPAAVGREHFPDLLALTGDAGAGGWLRARAAQVHRVWMPDAAVDIDTAEDSARLAAIP